MPQRTFQRIFLPLAVDFDDDEKVARLARYTKPGEARALRDLLVAMWRYCKRETSDGHVPFEIVGKLVYPDSPRVAERDADRLVDCGLAERTETGYFLPGYLKQPHNKSRQQLNDESAKKAEAGRAGGIASGMLRRAEADAKHSASSLVQHDEAIDRDREQTTETGSSSEGGERPVTLRPVAATKLPQKINPDEVCTRHADGNPDDEPCRGCQRVEERRRRRGDRDSEKASVAAAELARTCTRCDGTWVVDDEKRPTRRRCDHRRTA